MYPNTTLWDVEMQVYSYQHDTVTALRQLCSTSAPHHQLHVTNKLDGQCAGRIPHAACWHSRTGDVAT